MNENIYLNETKTGLYPSNIQGDNLLVNNNELDVSQMMIMMSQMMRVSS